MSTPTCEGLRAAWVEQQAREAAKQASVEFDAWLAAERANPYEESPCGG